MNQRLIHSKLLHQAIRDLNVHARRTTNHHGLEPLDISYSILKERFVKPFAFAHTKDIGDGCIDSQNHLKKRTPQHFLVFDETDVDVGANLS